MNKLLKLINEYEEEGIIFDEVDDEECFVDIHPCTLWTEYNGHLWFNNANKVQFDKWMFDRVAISKEYGFIKWLVDNDKIDDEENNRINRRKVRGEDKHGEFRICKLYINCAETEEDLDVELFDDYERLLMHLAIQDEPIEFLISILK